MSARTLLLGQPAAVAARAGWQVAPGHRSNPLSTWWRRPEPYGVFLRLLLMPVGACSDLLGQYWVSHQFVYHGVIPAGQAGGYYHTWPSAYLHATWLWLIKPLLGSSV